MSKRILITMGCCLCLFFCLQTTLSFAASQSNPARMQNHIEKVKLKKPSEYQKMFDRAGGNISNCLSCHVDIIKKKNSSSQTNPR